MTHVIADRYELVETLGSSAMGAVWLGRDRVLDREVAVKQVGMPDGLSGDFLLETHANIVQGARSAARLDHPGIVTVYDVVEQDDRPWIVTQLVRARSLEAALWEDGPLPPARVAAIGLELLDALRAAHATGVLHRGVAPGNVLLPTGRAVLTDFGIGDIVGELALEPAYPAMDVRRFLAPERFQGRTLTAASDLWSLGAVLYAAVEGRPPYSGPDTWSVMSALVADEPDPLRLAGPLTPVLHALLRKDPHQRIGPDEAARLLRQVTAQDAPPTAPAQPPSTPPPFPPGFPPPAPDPRTSAMNPWGSPHQGTPGGPAQRRGPQWALIVPAGILAVVLVAAAIGAALLYGLDRRESSAAPSSGPSDRATTPTPAYREYRGSGYVVRIPRTWGARMEDDGVTFSDSADGMTGDLSLNLHVSAAEAGDGGSVSRVLEEASADFQADETAYPGYRQEEFSPNLGYQGEEAADLQFSFTLGGVPHRMRVRLFWLNGAVYGAYLSAEHADWGTLLPHYWMFLRTLRPA